jgi:DNA-binding transcriptional MocR family regulator
LKWKFSKRAQRAKASEIRELLKVTGTPGWISLAGGYPFAKLLSKEKFLVVAKEVILNKREKALQYGPTEGSLELRETILKMEKENGVKDISIENIIITTGSQQGLKLLAEAFIEEGGNKVIVEAPSYLGALQAFSLHEAEFVSVPLDEQGMKIGLLKEKLKRDGKDAKFIYTVPTFHNPATVCLSTKRREELIELAREFEIPIVEDDPYSKISFTQQNYPSLLSLGGTECVIKLGTFSKIISGGLRMGWMVASKEVIEKVVKIKQSADLCTPPLCQYLAAEFIRRGFMEEYIETAKKVYKEKRDVMLGSLKKYCQGKMEWTEPQGGLFVWGFTPKINTDELFMKAREKKVAFVPGSAFYPHREDHNHLRLNYSLPSKEEIEEGIRRLGELLN